MEIQGKLIKINDPVTGEGRNGQWKRQDFIIETIGQYPRKICFTVNSDKIDTSTLAVGNDITVSINIESREYNGRWFTDIRAWQINQGISQQSSNIEIQGVIIQALQPFSGTSKTGKTWKRQDFVLETQEQYPKKICFSVWGDRINPAQLQPQTAVTINVDVESREGSNGGWFTSVQAFRMSQGITNPVNNGGYGIQNDSTQTTPQIDILTQNDIQSNSETDDLPF